MYIRGLIFLLVTVAGCWLSWSVANMTGALSQQVLLAGVIISLCLAGTFYILLTSHARAKALAVEQGDQLQQVRAELDRLSRGDQVTGLSNRRFFEEQLTLEWSRAAREKTPISLLLIDIDYFKAFNERHGAAEGDRCLQRLATTIATELKRPADTIARFSGGEFVVLLPETDEQVEALAENCRLRVAEAGFSGGAEDTGGPLTVSIGVATVIPDNSISAHALLKAADDGLRQAKSEGRNRVVVTGSVAA